MMLRFCTACPAAPLPRLSIAQIARTTHPSTSTRSSASFVPTTAATLGARSPASTRTNGLPRTPLVRCRSPRRASSGCVEDRVRVDQHSARERHDVRREGDARRDARRVAVRARSRADGDARPSRRRESRRSLRQRAIHARRASGAGDAALRVDDDLRAACRSMPQRQQREQRRRRIAAGIGDELRLARSRRAPIRSIRTPPIASAAILRREIDHPHAGASNCGTIARDSSSLRRRSTTSPAQRAPQHAAGLVEAVRRRASSGKVIAERARRRGCGSRATPSSTNGCACSKRIASAAA